MAKAFLLITTEVGKEGETLESLKSIPEIKEVHELYGIYDIIAIVETETVSALKNIISLKVRRLEKIRSTVTMIVT